MPFKTKVKGKVLSEQSCGLVENIIKYFIREKNNGGSIVPIDKLQERVAMATGVSTRTLRNILAESENIETGIRQSFKTPGKKRCKGAPKSVIKGSERELLIELVLNFHKTEKKQPTVRNILKKFRAETGYTGVYDSFRIALRNIGFRCTKTATNQKWIIEPSNSNEEIECISDSDSEIESCTTDSDEEMSEVHNYILPDETTSIYNL